jgi:AcrR family transcriptional regulator
MATVAADAGVGVGTVYRHFATKEALMGELVSLCAYENAEAGRAALLVEDPWEGFAGMVRGICDQMAADAARRRVWSAASPEAFARAEQAKSEMSEACARVIARGHEAGALREDFTPQDMPGLMCGLAAAIDAGPPRGWQRLVEFALDGLRSRPA